MMLWTVLILTSCTTAPVVNEVNLFGPDAWVRTHKGDTVADRVTVEDGIWYSRTAHERLIDAKLIEVGK